MQTQRMNSVHFLRGGGEMGALIRAFDWGRSPIGNPESWPQSLRTTVAMILSSKFPMFLWWGDELIQFYNDAYRPSLGNQGKHPAALGQGGRECWPEIWSTIEPLIDQVLTNGESTWSENQLIPIYRNGRLENVYWTFGYSAVLNETGQIGGVLVVCQETTEAVLNQQHLKASEARFRSIFEQAPLAISLLRGRDMIIEVGNKQIFELWGKDPSVTGMPLLEALPEIEGQGFIELLEGVYATGEPFFGISTPAKLLRRGQWDELYFDFVYTPLRDASDAVTGVMVLATEVTEQVLDRKKLEESEERYRQLSAELDGQVQQRTRQLQVSIQDLQRSNESLEQFAYVASHDLQEPLRKIQSFGSILHQQYGPQLGEGAELVNRMALAASRMSVLIRDLLSFSRISTGQADARLVSLSQVVSGILTNLELPIQEAGAVIEVGSLPNVLGDSSQLEQLFQNLLSNAIKFRQTGPSGNGVAPHIQIGTQCIARANLPAKVKSVREASTYHRIDVSDNGIGFDQQYVDRIFQVFQRLHGRSQYAGTGIGLAICEKVAINHGGAITAHSQPNQGATFSVYLPADGC